jgi:hypothetical protein
MTALVRRLVFAAALVAASALGAGCGIAAQGSPAAVPLASAGPTPVAGNATAVTRGAIVRALSSVAVQFGDATTPYRPPESARLRDAPRSVFQVVLPDQPNAGFILVYEFRDEATAVDAANEEAGYLGTGAARVQQPFGTQHVIRQLGPTLILYSWLPSASSDPTAGDVGAALNTIGVGFTVPN